MAGILSRSRPSPVTGVVATAWKAGIWGAGAGAEGREGAGAETRVDGVEGAGLAVGAARRTGARRGAETVNRAAFPSPGPRPRPATSTRRLRRPATEGNGEHKAATRLDHAHPPHAWY